MEHFDHQDVVRRLHSMGQQPVDPATAERHTSHLAGITPFAARSRRRPMVTAAMVAGALLGGTGLAAALPGPLPTQASSVAKSALAKVNLADGNEHKAAGQAKAAAAKASGHSGESHGTARYLTGCVLPGSGGPFTGNHGAYVKAWVQAAVDDPATPVNEKSEAATKAAQSDCGKPLSSVDNAQSGSTPADAGRPADAGKPAHAGKPATTGNSADAGKPATAGNSAEAGKPESPGKSDEAHPPAEAGQGAENSSVPEVTTPSSSTSTP